MKSLLSPRHKKRPNGLFWWTARERVMSGQAERLEANGRATLTSLGLGSDLDPSIKRK